MPELPEVARAALSLNNVIQGKSLNDVVVHSGRYSRHGDPAGLSDFIEELPAHVDNVTFCGKLILFEFTGRSGKKWWLWNTLGMGGGWLREKSKHGHVEFITSGGSVFFTDIRNFGTLKFTDSEEETIKKKSSIGPNHLSDTISDELFKSRLLKQPNRTMPEVLMNQKLIGGIGNYIKAEILYIAGISPHRIVNTLSDEEFSKLNAATNEVVNKSFGSKGASLRTYKGMDGENGDFVFSLKVYGRTICENGYQVIRETTKEGRTTHWVPQIQK
jgi:formamidopyrimidine-DNA glycosylase